MPLENPTVKLRKGKRGFYFIRIYFADHDRPEISTQTKDENEAKAVFNAFVEECLPGMITERQQGIDRDNPKISELIDWYLHTYTKEISAVAESTWRKYHQVLYNFAGYARMQNIGRCQQISMRLLQEWIQDYGKFYRGPNEGHAPRTKRRLIEVVRGMFKAAERSGLYKCHIVHWEMPKVTHEEEKIPLTQREISEVIEILKDRSPSILQICTFLALTGFRVGDAMALRKRNIDWKNNCIRIEMKKTKKNLVFPLNNKLNDLLESSLNRDPKPTEADHVFVNASGNPFRYNTVYSRLTDCLRKVNYPKKVTPHIFRHSFGSIMAEQGIDPRVLQALMGHSKVEITLEYYVHVNETHKEKAFNQYAHNIRIPFGGHSGDKVLSLSKHIENTKVKGAG